MPYHWPAQTEFSRRELDVLDRSCPVCGRGMSICDHRYRHLHTLQGPLELVCKLNHCPDPDCPGHAKTRSPESEVAIAPPPWAIGWDVFCWIGHRRFSRHWAIPQIRAELQDTYRITLSDDAISQYTHRYQAILAARQQDPEALRRQYESVPELILTIDGLQPEKGHETLYVVRELTQKRVWFAAGPDRRHGACRGPTVDRQSQGVGRGLGQGCRAVDLRQAGRLRDRDRRGIPGRAPSLLRSPFPPRSGQARCPGGR